MANDNPKPEGTSKKFTEFQVGQKFQHFNRVVTIARLSDKSVWYTAPHSEYEFRTSLKQANELIRKGIWVLLPSIKKAMPLARAKNTVARNNGFPNWTALYDFTAKDGAVPCVVAQLIEAYMTDAHNLVIEQALSKATKA